VNAHRFNIYESHFSVLMCACLAAQIVYAASTPVVIKAGHLVDVLEGKVIEKRDVCWSKVTP
jgi:hypothetical protein